VSDDQPTVLAVAVHAPRTASTRLRLAQYAPGLERAGVHLQLWTLLTDDDDRRWFRLSALRRLALSLWRLATRLRALVVAVRQASVVVIHREVLPFGPPIIEGLIARRRHVIWDVDDAVWEHHTSIPWLPRSLRATGDKYARTAVMADEVWAGSDVLAEWCRTRGAKVAVIPTVVDAPTTLPAEGRSRTVTWIGSPTTGPFLERIVPSLSRIDPPIDLQIIGASATPGLPGATVRDWSASSEEAALHAARVGLYQIDREHPLADGKCGLKAILYMAHGVPPVVTPTPTNAHIVRHGVEGLHAETPEEWASAVRLLLDDRELWARLRQAGHRRAVEDYSLDVWVPRVAERLADVMSGRARRS
jgi:hypothetical protein